MCPLPPVDTIAQRSDPDRGETQGSQDQSTTLPLLSAGLDGSDPKGSHVPYGHEVGSRSLWVSAIPARPCPRCYFSARPNIPIVFCGGVTLALSGMLATPVKSLPPLASIDAGARAIGREEEPEISRFQARVRHLARLSPLCR